MKLYTRTGDDGSSGLFGGDRVSKSHLRLVAYGTLDELNSIMGLLRLHATPACADEAALLQVQQDLFVLGAILATPAARQDLLSRHMSRPTWDLGAMEADIDRLTALAPPMTAFVLPGGTAASAYAHQARTVCRRAERGVTLTHEEPMNPVVVAYITASATGSSPWPAPRTPWPAWPTCSECQRGNRLGGGQCRPRLGTTGLTASFSMERTEGPSRGPLFVLVMMQSELDAGGQ